MSIQACPDNVFTTMDSYAAQLAHKFCLCPVAKMLLNDQVDSLVNPLFVSVGDFPFAKTDYKYGDTTFQNLLEATIVIPENRIKTPKAISEFSFELFNCINRDKIQHLFKQALKGEIGVDEFSHAMEIIEQQSGISHDALMDKCAASWNLKKSDLDDNYRNTVTDPVIFAWEADFMCHTDVHRGSWIDLFKKNYCKIHPEDKRSCKMTKKALCDFSAYKNLSYLGQGRIMAKRICERISSAPKKVQLYFQKIVEANCPQQLGRTPQAVKTNVKFKDEV
jgi:hypothetical protein